MEQNSYAPRGKRRPGRREAQSREAVNKFIKLPVYRKQCLYVLKGNWSSVCISYFAVA
jgi:hypothetical protein